MTKFIGRRKEFEALDGLLRKKIGFEIIDEIKQKLSLLKIPKNFSFQPILIHVNGVEESVVDSGFFSRIIDFSELLNNS